MYLLLLLSPGFPEKYYQKTMIFFFNFKIQFNIYYIAEFYDNTFSATKMAFLSMQSKFFLKSILISKFTKPVPSTLWKDCYFLIKFLKSQNNCFKKSITYLLYLTIL